MKKDIKKRARREKQDDASRTRTRLLKADQVVDYRDYEFLSKFMTERGKIVPGRVTGANAKQLRQVKRAIRRARARNGGVFERAVFRRLLRGCGQRRGFEVRRTLCGHTFGRMLGLPVAECAGCPHNGRQSVITCAGRTGGTDRWR